MLSSTASPFKRRSVEIPQSMQKLIAKLQFQKRNGKSTNCPLSLKYTSLGRKRVNFPFRDVIDPTMQTIDLTVGNLYTKDAPATSGVPAQNNNASRNSVAESTLQDYNSFKKRKRMDLMVSVEGINNTTTKKTDGSTAILNEESPIIPQENVDSSVRDSSTSFGANDDMIFVEQSSSVQITTDINRVSKSDRPNTSAFRRQKSIMGQEFSGNQHSTAPAEKSIVASFEKEKQLLISGHSDEEEPTVSPRVNVPDVRTSTNTIIERGEISNDINSENTNDSTSAATVDAAEKDDDACGFITLNNIMQYSKRGSFTNDLFGDDGKDDEMSECAKEFQDKGVQVSDESMQAGSDICEQLRPLLQKIRGLNDLILKAKKQFPNFSKIHSTSDVGEA